jgi:predicted lactoylglutathione lyase
MNENEKVPSLIPVLTVEDVEKAAAFYKQLGFSEVFSIPDQKGQLVQHTCVKETACYFSVG